jgi:ABC-type transport system involved in multi-copper enzyme maturation permease subunit
MNTAGITTIIKTSVQVILLFFGLFGGFLLHAAPPDYNSEFKLVIGLAQFVSLLLFLLISVVLNLYAKRRQKGAPLLLKVWLLLIVVFVVGFIVMVFRYYQHFNTLTVWQSTWKIRFIRGTELTEESTRHCKEYKISAYKCESHLLNIFYTSGEIAFENALWTEASVQENRSRLFRDYVLLIITLSGALFSLVEIIALYSTRPKKG